LEFEATSSVGRDIAIGASGAIIGGVIGAVLGGKKGAAIGAGAGGSSIILLRGREVELPAGVKLAFQLTKPLVLEP